MAGDRIHRAVSGDGENGIVALDTGYLERCAAVVPATLQSIQQSAFYAGSQSTDPEVLGKVTAPVLLLRGEQTARATIYADSEPFVARHVADTHVRAPLPGLGHWPPILEPEPIARGLISFFEPAGYLRDGLPAAGGKDERRASA